MPTTPDANNDDALRFVQKIRPLIFVAAALLAVLPALGSLYLTRLPSGQQWRIWLIVGSLGLAVGLALLLFAMLKPVQTGGFRKVVVMRGLLGVSGSLGLMFAATGRQWALIPAVIVSGVCWIAARRHLRRSIEIERERQR
jgi:hypothetical protein